MEPTYENIIALRSSRRSYRPDILNAEVRSSILNILESHSRGPLGSLLDFRLVDHLDLAPQKIRLGTYGFIQGARYYIAGQIIPSKTAFLDYGHALESIIIELTRLGLGTCWLGGTFNRGEFARAVDLKDGFVIPAVTPVGYATSRWGIGERLIRLGAGSKNRLPWTALFFDQDPGHSLAPDEAGPFAGLFEAVRLAPSASNKQPWRIIRVDSRYRFFLCRTPGYNTSHIPVDLQVIDIGIALSHWSLMAKERGIRSVWIQEDLRSFPEGMEYMITSQIEN